MNAIAKTLTILAIAMAGVAATGEADAKGFGHPVHGPGSSHNPIVFHPVHGPGSSHNPIICKPGARPGSLDCRGVGSAR